MPYIETQEVKEIRNNIKKAFPDFKFSIRREHHSTLVIVILEGPVDFGGSDVGVNQYWYKEHYEGNPDALEFLDKMFEIIKSVKVNKTEHIDSDYGNIPSYYMRVSVGKWDKPYKLAA